MRPSTRYRPGGGFPGIGRGWRPPPATSILLGLTLGFTLLTLWTGAFDWFTLSPQTLPGLRLPALVTNTFVNLGESIVGLIIFMAIGVFLFQSEVRWLWFNRKVELLVAVALVFAVGIALNRTLVPGVWGLLTAMLVLAWFGTAAERIWGSRRLVVFCGIVVLATNLFGALVVWAWPSSILPLVGTIPYRTFGNGPLMNALLTAWALNLGRQRVALLNIEGYKLVWVLVAIEVIGLLFTGVLQSFMGLLAIGLARTLIRGDLRPRLWIDRLRLYLIERRRARERRRFRVVPGGREDRTLHRLGLREASGVGS